jgi:hypothetical protein
MAKIALVVLVNDNGNEMPAELLEDELQQILAHNPLIITRWAVEKITVMDNHGSVNLSADAEQLTGKWTS